MSRRERTTIAAYLAGLVVVFGVAFGVGTLVAPDADAPTPAPTHSRH